MTKRDYIYIGAIVILIVLLATCKGGIQIGAGDSSDGKNLKTKEVNGSFKPITDFKPVEKPKDPLAPKIIVKWKDSIIEVENQLNTEVFNRYVEAKDSIAKMKVLLDAIAENEYNTEQEDSVVKIMNKIKVFGSLSSLETTYTKKSEKIGFKTYRILGGGEAGTKTDLSAFVYQGNVMYQSAKGDIYMAGFDTNGFVKVGFATEFLNYTRQRK